MRVRRTWLRLGRSLARQLGVFCGWLNGACARMNAGLAAFAVVLAVIVVVTAVIRVPEILAQHLDPAGEPAPASETTPVG